MILTEQVINEVLERLDEKVDTKVDLTDDKHLAKLEYKASFLFTVTISVLFVESADELLGLVGFCAAFIGIFMISPTLTLVNNFGFNTVNASIVIPAFLDKPYSVSFGSIT